MRRLATITLVVLAACQRTSEARLAAEWRGARRGAFSAAASAVHCAESGILLVEAIRADSGIAMAHYPVDPAVIAPGTFDARAGSVANPPKPAVLVALRSFESTEVRGWEAYGGTVTLDTAGGVLSGRFDLRMQLVDGADTLRMTGTITKVPVTRDSTGCATRIRRSY